MANVPTDWGRYVERWGYKDELDMFTDLYTNQGLSYPKLADRFNVSTGTIIARIRFLGIQPRPRGGANNPGYLRKRLFYLDQRAVFGYSLKKVVVFARVSQALVYKYRHMMAGGFDAILHNHPNLGSATLRNIIKNASRASSHPTPPVSPILPGEEESR